MHTIKKQKYTQTQIQICMALVLSQDVCVWPIMVGHLWWNSVLLKFTDIVYWHRIKIAGVLRD